MANLTGNSIRNTFESLLKFVDNLAATTGLKRITDGLGNNTALSLGDDEAKVHGSLEVDSINLPNGASNEALMADGSTQVLESDKNYVHTQNTASATWSITHNLGKRASVTVVDSGDNVCYGDVQYTNDNELVITFSASFSGKAYLN